MKNRLNAYWQNLTNKSVSNDNKNNKDIDKIIINNPKKEISPITDNYLNQIKKIFEDDKTIILNENNLL